MINAVNKVFNDIVFKIMMISILIVMLMPYLQQNYGGYIKYGLVFGAIVCVVKLLEEKLFFIKDKAFVLLCLFCVSYFVSILINDRTLLVRNAKEFIYMIVFFFLFFFCVGKNKIDVRKEIYIVSWVVLALTFIVSLIGFIFFLLGVEDWYYFDEGIDSVVRVWYVMGYYNGRLNGLFNANASAALNLVSLVISFFFLEITDSKKDESKGNRIFIDIILIFNILIQYFCLLLSNARGAKYSGLVLVFIFIVLKVIKSNKITNAKRIMCSFAAIGLCVLLVVISSVTMKGLSYLPGITQRYIDKSDVISFNLSMTSDNITSFKVLQVEKIDVGRVDSSEMSSGRLALWRAGLTAFKSSPIFGLTREGFVNPVYNLVYMQTGEYNNAVITGGLHNIYITVLVSSGVIGFLLLAACVVVVLYKAIFVLIKEKEIDTYLFYSLLMSFTFFIVELVESRILYQANIFNVLFWIYFGYLYYLANSKYKEIKDKKDLVS